jgi:hypothetical protein
MEQAFQLNGFTKLRGLSAAKFPPVSHARHQSKRHQLKQLPGEFPSGLKRRPARRVKNIASIFARVGGVPPPASERQFKAGQPR